MDLSRYDNGFYLLYVNYANGLREETIKFTKE